MSNHTDARPDLSPALDPGTTPASRVGASRRDVLIKGAGLAALVTAGGATLSACSSDTSTPTSSAAPASSAPSSAASAPSSAAASASSSSAAGGASVTAASVPVGGGVIMPDANYVVTQPTKGTFKAFSKKCTHMGCPVAMVSNGEIVCKCHGSHFSVKDGSVVSGPAKQPLPEAKATVSGANVVVSG